MPQHPVRKYSLRYDEFTVSCAVAVAQMKHIALLRHDGCGKIYFFSIKKAFLEGPAENAG